MKRLVLKHTRMNLYKIQFEGGGEVPKELHGEYNNKRVAEAKMAMYLNNRRSKKNVKTTVNKGV